MRFDLHGLTSMHPELALFLRASPGLTSMHPQSTLFFLGSFRYFVHPRIPGFWLIFFLWVSKTLESCCISLFLNPLFRWFHKCWIHAGFLYCSIRYFVGFTNIGFMLYYFVALRISSICYFIGFTNIRIKLYLFIVQSDILLPSELSLLLNLLFRWLHKYWNQAVFLY